MALTRFSCFVSVRWRTGDEDDSEMEAEGNEEGSEGDEGGEDDKKEDEE